MTTTETNMTTSMDSGFDRNSFECESCQKAFTTHRGLLIHQGRICNKKSKQCRSSDRKTRSKSSQESNHSGTISTSAEAPTCNELPADVAKKPKIEWPLAKDTKRWKELEAEVLKRTKRAKGTAAEKLEKLSTAIYDTGAEMFGIKIPHEKKIVTSSGKSRRNKRMEQLRKEKKDLHKQWKMAPVSDKEGLLVLYEDLKKKCRQMQKNIRSGERRKKAKRARQQFLKNPYGFTKRLFTEAKSGTLQCTKEELDEHLKEAYHDPKKNEALPVMPNLLHPTKPRVKFNMSGWIP